MTDTDLITELRTIADWFGFGPAMAKRAEIVELAAARLEQLTTPNADPHFHNLVSQVEGLIAQLESMKP